MSDTVVVSAGTKTITRADYYKQMSEETVAQLVRYYEAVAQGLKGRGRSRSDESIYAEVFPQLLASVGEANLVRYCANEAGWVIKVNEVVVHPVMANSE